MTKSFFSSTFSKVVAAGVIATACVGAVAMPASAAERPASTDVDGIPAYLGKIELHPAAGITLGKAELIEKTYFYAVGVRGMVMLAEWEGNQSAPGVAAEALPILKDGQPTGFYIEPQILTNPLFEQSADAQCDVYEGKPGAGNPGHKATGSFTCDVTPYYEQLNHWDLTVKPASK